MNLAAHFNDMIIQDVLDEYGLIRHQLTYPDRQAIPDAQLEYVRQDKAMCQATGKKWHPLAGTPAYAMYEDANYVGNRYLLAQVWRWLRCLLRAKSKCPVRCRLVPSAYRSLRANQYFFDSLGIQGVDSGPTD